MECVGHFHGESAEQYWPEANQLGPHVRQMNNGHRQDTLINHHGDWNWKKTMALASTLSEDLALATKNYAKKQKHLIGLSASFREHLPQWRSMARTSAKVGKEVVSVYRHSSTKVPSQQAIFQKLINDDEAFARTTISKGKIANFMDKALKIQDLQRQLSALIADRNRKPYHQAPDTHIRLAQNSEDNGAIAAPPVHEEKLFLPSDFPTAAERLALRLDDLATEESRWREGQIFDTIRALQNNVKATTALRGDKAKNDRQQKQNSRSLSQIREALRRRDLLKLSYSVAQAAQLVLDGATRFPVLTDADFYMKPVLDRRRLGDSKMSDGALWTALAPEVLEEEEDTMDVDVDPAPEDLSTIAATGDRVQWFRAEAEMQRWREQKEQKLAELLRTRRSFLREQSIWTALASGANHAGYDAYAQKKAWMYARMAEDTKKHIILAGHANLLADDANFVEWVQGQREEEDRAFNKALQELDSA
ncbi:hypothetical protein C8F01DRAFT_1248023 [Mycena amicta]|nr:hypothetical protein C8F01DRAFT_1248023 [Mycena amicta]